MQVHSNQMRYQLKHELSKTVGAAHAQLTKWLDLVQKCSWAGLEYRDPLDILKAVYYTGVVHNFNLQEKTTSTVEVTTNFVEKLKAHFEKKLLY